MFGQIKSENFSDIQQMRSRYIWGEIWAEQYICMQCGKMYGKVFIQDYNQYKNN